MMIESQNKDAFINYRKILCFKIFSLPDKNNRWEIGAFATTDSVLDNKKALVIGTYSSEKEARRALHELVATIEPMEDGNIYSVPK